jgi:hypothetical protein
LIQLANPVLTQNPYSQSEIANGNVPQWASYGISSSDYLQIWSLIRTGVSPDVASDLNFGQGFILTYAKNATRDSQFTVKNTDEYDLWARVLLHPDGGNITFQIDNQPSKTKTINTNSSIQQGGGFAWVNIGKYSLDQGEHKLKITNQDGNNVINLLSVISTTDYVNLRQKATSLIEQSSGVILYVFDNAVSNWDMGSSNFSKNIFIPAGGNYLLFTQADEDTSLSIELDAVEQDFSNPKTGLNWTCAGSINLSLGDHNLTCFTANNTRLTKIALLSSDRDDLNLNEYFGNMPTKASIVNYKSIDPTSITVTVNASKPFLLVLPESYSPFWSLSYDVREVPATPIYSFLNCFQVNQTGTYTLSIMYKPQNFQTLSMYVSGFSLLVTLSYLTVSALLSLLKKRHVMKCLIKT